jgi:hypothetical protein
LFFDRDQRAARLTSIEKIESKKSEEPRQSRAACRGAGMKATRLSGNLLLGGGYFLSNTPPEKRNHENGNA